MSKFVRGLAALCLAVVPAPAFATGDAKVAAPATSPATTPEPETPAKGDSKIVDLLFQSRHLDLTSKGSVVTYRFEKSGSDERLVGKNYTDDIALAIDRAKDNGQRDVVLKIFTGESARDPQAYPDMTINPLFAWYLNRAVNTFNSLAGGNPMYAKHMIRSSFRDKAHLEEIKFDYNGKQVDAYKVSVAPFADDQNASKMQGFENTTLTVIVSNQVPGYFVDLLASYNSTQAAGPKLEEHIKLVGMGETK